MDDVIKKQLNILIQLAEVDKHFAKAERDMIFKIAQDRGVASEQVNELIRKPEPIESLGSLSTDQKFDYLMACMELIFADHNIFEAEVIFCKTLAIKLGFKKSVVEYLVENFEKTSHNDLKTAIYKQFI